MTEEAPEVVRVGVPRETFPGETRVALTPAVVPMLTKAGYEVVVESGAGAPAGFPDEAYREQSAAIAPTREEVFTADVIAQVRTPSAGGPEATADLEHLRADQIIVGLADPLGSPEIERDVAERKVTLFAMELIPRISRAQSMDVLSSQATVAGYKAVLESAERLTKMFPMLTTAAGTVPPAKVLVIGAGVAGLQAIATARRLGGVVQAYDVRPAAREEVESLGARFVELPLQPGDAEDESGYAKALGEEFTRRQQEYLAEVASGMDVVITTALIPGKPAPVLITAAAVRGMARGAIVIDIAAERGGNCELTKADEEIDVDGVTILGPTNLPATVPNQASQMYARNLTAFLTHLRENFDSSAEPEDEIVTSTMVTRGGRVVHARVRELLGEVVA